MEEIATFKFASLPKVTFTATRTASISVDAMSSAAPQQHAVGWIEFQATDDVTGTRKMRSGSIGPVTAEEADTFSNAESVGTFFGWEAVFRFPSLPGVSFYTERSTEDVDDRDGGLRRAGWVTIVGRRDSDGAFVFGSGTSGPDGSSNEYSQPPSSKGAVPAFSLSLHPLETVIAQHFDWGARSIDETGKALVAMGSRDQETVVASPGDGADLIRLPFRAAWGDCQPVSSSPRIALGDGHGNVSFYSERGFEEVKTTRSLAENPWGTWAYVDRSWKLVLGMRDSYRLWDPTGDSGFVSEVHVGSGGLSWGHALHVSYTNGDTSETESASVLVAGGTRGVRFFDLASGREVPAPTSPASPQGPLLWGAATNIGGVEVVATGGPANEVTLWCLGIDGFHPVQLSLDGNEIGQTAWGAWCHIGADPILAVGGVEPGRVWMWHPAMHPGPQQGLNLGLHWANWGLHDGKPALYGDDGSQVRAFELTLGAPVSAKPDYRSDAVTSGDSADVLDRRVEAAALAEVIASRTARPPLSIGIFGQWGEGKSHFMNLLHQEITDISAPARDNSLLEVGTDTQHRDIRQIRFNAWHYSETDLWASLVSEIFSQLGASAEDSEDIRGKQRQQSRLLSEIIAERHLPERIAAEKARRDQLRRVRSHADAATLSKTHPSALKASLADIDPDLAAEFDDFIGAAAGWTTYRRRQIMRVLAAMPWVKIGLTLIAILAIGLGVWTWMPNVPAKILSGIVALSVIGGGYWTEVRPKFESLKEQLNAASRAVQSFRQASQRLIESMNKDIDLAVRVSDSTIETLERELRDLTAAGQLAGLVVERATDNTYRQSLGLMTEIREDFERMSRLLTRSEIEYEANDVVGDSLPRIDRIVLYIDDLDRCPPRRVVEVLEAVHLMLAVELFVVVLAVDPRWLRRAVAVHYSDVLSETTPEDGRGEWASTPTQYLEKIFQIVLYIPSLSSSGYAALLEDLVVRRPVRDEREGANIDAAARGDEVRVQHRPQTGAPDLAPQIGLPPPREMDRVDPLAFDGDELLLLKLLGPPIITTPRAVKRLVNSYALMTAIRRLRSQPSSGHALRPALVLLALLIGYPKEGPVILQHMSTSHRSTPETTWTGFVRDLAEAVNRSEQPLDAILLSRIANSLVHVTAEARHRGVALPEQLGTWTSWIPSVARLTFSAGAAVSGQFQAE
ncbi:KAP family P-loop NTPase fold protein [Mycobacterium sp. BMJ-28]